MIKYRKETIITDYDGQKIWGVALIPETGQERYPLAIYSHGLTVKCNMKKMRLSAKKSRIRLTGQENKRYTTHEILAAIRKKIMR